MPADDSDSQPEPVPDSQPPPAPVSDNDGPWHDGLSSAERQEHALRECLEGRSLTLLPDKPDTDALDVAAMVDALRGERLTDFALLFRNADVGRCLVASVKLIGEMLDDEGVSGGLVPPVRDVGGEALVTNDCTAECPSWHHEPGRLVDASELTGDADARRAAWRLQGAGGPQGAGLRSGEDDHGHRQPEPATDGQLGLGGKLASDYHAVLNGLWSRMVDLGEGKAWATTSLAKPDPKASSALCQREGHYFAPNVGGKVGNVHCTDCDARRHNGAGAVTYPKGHKPWTPAR